MKQEEKHLLSFPSLFTKTGEVSLLCAVSLSLDTDTHSEQAEAISKVSSFHAQNINACSYSASAINLLCTIA